MIHLENDELFGYSGPIVQKVDNAIHWINPHYPLDSAIGLPNTNPLDMVIYPVDSATVILCRAYILLHSKPLLSNMYLYFRMSYYIFFSRLPYYVHSLFQEKGSLQFPPIFFSFCLSCPFVFLLVCLFVVFFMFALSQFTGPDYLAAWNRLVHKMFVAIGITLCFISG